MIYARLSYKNTAKWHHVPFAAIGLTACSLSTQDALNVVEADAAPGLECKRCVHMIAVGGGPHEWIAVQLAHGQSFHMIDADGRTLCRRRVWGDVTRVEDWRTVASEHGLCSNCRGKWTMGRRLLLGEPIRVDRPRSRHRLNTELREESAAIRREIGAPKTQRSTRFRSETRRCVHCQVEFTAKRLTNRFCSRECNWSWLRGKTWQQRLGYRETIQAQERDDRWGDRSDDWYLPQLDAPLATEDGGLGGSLHDIIEEDASGGYW